MSELEIKLNCLMADVGAQVGEILRCIIEVEVASQVSRIQQLQAVLNGTACGSDALPPA